MVYPDEIPPLPHHSHSFIPNPPINKSGAAVFPVAPVFLNISHKVTALLQKCSNFGISSKDYQKNIEHGP